MRYTTDLTDTEWQLLQSFFSKPSTTGRPREHSYRELLNAMFYLVRTSCQWRNLPTDIAPWGTVYHYFRLPTAIRPLLERLEREKREHTLEFPFQPSRRWQQFFIKVKKQHLCFHCLRVTYVNRLRRAGVPREVAMRLVNHASELVHQVYQREKVEDLVQWRDAVQFPA